MSALGSKLQLCGALLVAAAFSEVGSAEGWRRIWRALSLWIGLLQVKNQAPPSLAARRIAKCSTCPLLFPPLFTCGSPLRNDLKDLKPQPCWCNMYFKATAKDATCYIDENCERDSATAGLGWGE